MSIDINTLYKNIQDDQELSEAMSNFLQCTKIDLLETFKYLKVEKSKGTISIKRDKRPQQEEQRLHYGYYNFKVPKKKKGEFREINIPENGIKKLQENLSVRLAKVSLSTAAMGSERGFDSKKNAEMHRYNQYMYSTDLKDAFPSVSAERVQKNLHGALIKLFDYSYPYLTKEQIASLIEALTALVTYHDKLPQGSTTSPNLMNIVMAGMDREIIKYLHNPDLGLVQKTYTRYVDDIVVSYKDRELMKEDQKALNDKWEAIEARLSINEPITRTIHTQAYVKDTMQMVQDLLELFYKYSSFGAVKQLSSAIAHISQTVFEYAGKLKGRIDSPIISMTQQKISQLQSDIAKGKGKGLIDIVQKDIKKILSDHGRKIQEKKNRTRHPGSHNELREVTGITMNANGDLSIPKDTLKKYVHFMQIFLKNPDELPQSCFENGKPSTKKIKLKIEGRRRYIERIRGKGNLPSNFKSIYEKVIAQLEEIGTKK